MVLSTNIIILITRIFFSKSRIVKILTKLKAVDDAIERISRRKMYRRTRSRVVKHSVILVLFLLCAHSCYYYILYNGTFGSILQVTVKCLCYTVFFVIFLEHETLVHMLLQRYEYINNRIMDYFEMEYTPEGMSHKAQNHHTSVSIVSENKWNLPTLTHSHRKSGTCGIHELRIAYIKLYDTVSLINSQFGIPILMQITTLVTVCVTIFYHVLYTFNKIDTNVHDFNINFRQFLRIFRTAIYGAQVAWLIVDCHRVMQEANKGILYIHRITACTNINYGTLLKLQALSNQLEDMKVEFTACGFFVLNLTLLGKIICGIFTYILIMVQLE